MPAYNATVIPAVLNPGDQKYLWGNSFAAAAGPTPGQPQAANDANVVPESIVTGQKSVQVTLAPQFGRNPGAMVEIVFSANPGVFEVDIEEAAIDAESSYLLNSSSTAYKITAATARPDGTYVAWAELQPQGGAFLRLNMVALANVVTTKAKVVYV